MSNKTIKLVDEHNINREAKIITIIEYEGTEYVVYSIDRDAENANIFVSKLVKEGNHLLLDEMQSTDVKEKIDNVVKEMIKLPLEQE